jgi:hypothetical protein
VSAAEVTMMMPMRLLFSRSQRANANPSSPGRLTSSNTNAGASRSTLPTIDTLIAATAERHGMVLATRNLRDFAFVEIAAVSPWGAGNPN